MKHLIIAAALLPMLPLVAQSPVPTAARADSALAACIAAAAGNRRDEAGAAARTALTLYRALERARPRDPGPLVGQARGLSQCELPLAGDLRKGSLYGKATTLLERALALDSTHWGARYSLALNHYYAPAFMGRAPEAIRQFEILLAQQGDATQLVEQAAPYAYLGDLYRRSGRPADAERVWRRGAALFPADARLRRRLGGAHADNTADGQETPPQSRFDYLVREDFFAGLAGDTAAFARAMQHTEETLAAHPEHAEALVWHGSGLVFRAGQAFSRNDVEGGRRLWDAGMAEMNRAAALEPDNVGVLIPRAATLLAAAREWPDPREGRNWLEQAAVDLETVLRLQTPYFRHLPAHARCELLSGVAEARHRLADTVRARGYYRHILRECAGTGYAANAEAWLAGKRAAGTGTCQGCHQGRQE